MAVIAAGALGAAIGGIVALVCGAVGGGRLIFDVQQIGLLSSIFGRGATLSLGRTETK